MGQIDMLCRRVHQLLTSYYDCRLSAKDRNAVAEHVEKCAHCLKALKQLHQVSALANPESSREAPASLVDKLLAAGLPLDRDAFSESLAQVRGKRIPEILRANLRGEGPVVFPSGEVAEGAWEFGLLEQLPQRTFDTVIDAIISEAFEKLDPVLPPSDVVLVCFSRPMHQCGMALANTLLAKGRRNVHVVMADDYYRPTLYCNAKELTAQFVVMLADVVHSGSLLDRLSQVCLSSAPCRVVALSIIDQNPARVGNVRRYALWKEDLEERTQPGSFSLSNRGSRHRAPRFFNPDTGRASDQSDLPAEIADPNRACETIERDLEGIEVLLPYIEATGALQPNRWLYRVCYPWVLDLIPLLDHPQAKDELLRRARECLADLSNQESPIPLVYPVERHRRAGKWANDLAGEFHWPVVAVGLEDRPNYRSLMRDQRRRLVPFGRAIIVDAAIRTGKTLESLVKSLRDKPGAPCDHIEALYAFNGLFEKDQEQLEKRLNVRVRSLFRLPFGPPIDPTGKRWRARLRETLAGLPSSPRTRKDAPAVELVREFCKRQLRSSGRRASGDTPEETVGNLRRALEDAARGARLRLGDIWKDHKRSRVSQLDVDMASCDPRIRNILYGSVANNVCPSLRESAALALSVLDDYSWLTKEWMGVQHKLFSKGDKPWQFLACITYWIKQKGDSRLKSKIRQAVEGFQESQYRQAGSLFPDPELKSRCESLIALLSED